MDTDAKEMVSGRRLFRPMHFILGGLCLFFVAYMLYPSFPNERPAPESSRCVSRVRQMIIGSLLYANEYDGTWHSSVGWMDTLTPYIKDERVFHDDHAEAEGGYGYAFRGKASRIVASMPENPSTYLLIFDSNLFGRSAYGDATSIPKEGRHDGKFVEGFMDGHAMAVLTGR